MTVKKRLFISNILMITIPVLLSITIGCFTMFTLRNFFGLRPGERVGDDYRFYYAVGDLNGLVTDAAGQPVSELIARLDELKAKKRLQALTIAVYEGETQIYQAGEALDQPALELVAQDTPGERIYLFDRCAFYALSDNGYQYIVYDTNYSGADGGAYESFRQTALNRMLLAFVMLIMIIMITNRLLTKFVINSIVTPLDQLIFGVRQIRDGNLTYRIDYQGQDEFKQVCEDFNEMALYLQRSVEGRQKDYDSRKELLAGVSHDLRTPLTSIKGYIIGLEQGIDTSPEIRSRYISVLKRKADELEVLVNQLFQFSKIDIGEFPMQIRPQELRRELILLTEELRMDYEGQGLVIECRDFPVPVTVAVDMGQLKTVIVNICENALKYVDASPPVLVIEGSINSGEAVIRLTDNGCGVPEKALPHLFDVFYRVDRSRQDTGKGSGLGLAISKRVIERMNGTITAELADTGGLCIRIALPIVDEEQADAQ